MDLRQELQIRYDKIVEQIRKLEALRNAKYQTSCQFRYNPGNSYSSLNIENTTNVEELIHANAFVRYKHEQYEASAAELDLIEYPQFKWCGYQPQHWTHDIKLRLKILTMDTELRRLKDLRDKIQPHLPEDNKIQQLLLELKENQ